MRYAAPIIAALALMLATGLVYGWWTERWQPSTAVPEAVARLDRMPGDLGPWKAEPADVDQEAFAQAGASGYWVRKYTNSRTGSVALVILLCGRSGKMSVHRPEHCYRGSGYEMAGAEARYVLTPADGQPVEFWTGRFRKEEATQARDLRIWWTWFAGDAWQAPDNSRWALARYPVVYKLYVVHDADGSAAADKGPYFDLIRRLMPKLTSALAPTPSAS